MDTHVRTLLSNEPYRFLREITVLAIIYTRLFSNRFRITCVTEMLHVSDHAFRISNTGERD